jgi:methylmalonyl-CoA mutase N-terminal domain/subunit
LADRIAGNERVTESGIPVDPVFDAASVADLDLAERLGEPGRYPFTRGVHASMYRQRPWTMRQYAGFATAEETNERFRYLLAHGAPGLSMAFDLPTQLGMDSDDPRALGEVGRVGVAIDSIDDMARVFDRIDLGRVSTSMTINAPASMLLLLYQLVAEEQGADTRALRGTIQNDVLKEYVARGNYIFPPGQSMRLTVDTFAYCHNELPNWNTISISGYHIREAGSTAVQEVAFTLANGVAYVQAAIDAGLSVDEFGPRLSFFFNAHNNLFEEVAKFRAARRLWARIMRERFGAATDRAMMLRFHAQTGGSTLTAQQPENNIVRVAVQVLSAALGGAQSIHANGFDEALALPTEHAAKLALRTQQVIATETGITDTVDPLGGSWYLERLTAGLEERAEALIDEIDRRGGAVACVDLMQEQIHESAYRHEREVQGEVRKIVGINLYAEDDEVSPEILRIDPEVERSQVARLADLRARRDNEAVSRLLGEVRAVARGTDNLLPLMREALRARASIGEVCGVLREEWGEHDRLRGIHHEVPEAERS